MSAHRLNAEQVESAIDKLVPLIAAPEDHEFFRGVLGLYAEECSSGQFAALVNRMTKAGAA